MTQDSDDKELVVAHRKVKVASARSRKGVKRPARKTTAKQSVKKVKPTGGSDAAEKITVKKKSAKRSKAPAKSKTVAKKTDRQTKRTAQVIDTSKPEAIRVTKKPAAKKPVKQESEHALVVDAPKDTSETKSTTTLTEQVKPAEAPQTTEKVEIVKLKPIKLDRLASDKPRILLGSEQYTEKRPLNDLNKTVEKAVEKAEPAKNTGMTPEAITVRKPAPVLTPQENLEVQAEFWSNLATKADSTKRLTAKASAPKPLDLNKVNERMRARLNIPVEQPQVSGKELKERAIKKALTTTEKMPVTPSAKAKKAERVRFTWGRILLALSCTVEAVFAIVYFVNLSAPDVSLKVAAMQSGIEASYPSYTPRGYSLSDITAEDGKITLSFRASDSKASYVLTEEKSSWDSNALLSNYVKSAYGEDYTVVREQGLTLYIANSGACWVNGGVLYKLEVKTGSLTKKQIKTIAVSL